MRISYMHFKRLIFVTFLWLHIQWRSIPWKFLHVHRPYLHVTVFETKHTITERATSTTDRKGEKWYWTMLPWHSKECITSDQTGITCRSWPVWMYSDINSVLPNFPRLRTPSSKRIITTGPLGRGGVGEATVTYTHIRKCTWHMLWQNWTNCSISELSVVSLNDLNWL